MLTGEEKEPPPPPAAPLAVFGHFACIGLFGGLADYQVIGHANDVDFGYYCKISLFIDVTDTLLFSRMVGWIAAESRWVAYHHV